MSSEHASFLDLLGADLAGTYRRTVSAGAGIDPAQVDADLACVRRDGYVILPDLLSTDGLADIKAADWVTQNLTTVRLFHTSGHLTAAPIRFLLRQLLPRTEAIGPKLAAIGVQEAERLLRHHQGQDFECAGGQGAVRGR